MHVGLSPFGGLTDAIDAFVDEVVRHVDPDLSAGRDPVYADDFVQWCTDVARVDLEDYQQEIGLSVVANRLTAVPSCHGAGKSFLAALIIVWWLTTREHAFVIWTAPRWAQVRAVIGRYVKQLLRDLNTGLSLNEAMYLKDASGEIIGMGVSPADNDENGINGIHADNVLIVVDEADGVKKNVWSGVRSFMSTSASRLLAIGNPLVRGSHFHKIVEDPRHGYRVIRIDGLRLPTMSRSAVAPYPELAALMEAEGIPYATEARAKAAAAKGITSPDLWAEWLFEWGPDNPYWHSRVRGVHPPISKQQMFTQAMLDDAYVLWEEMRPQPGDPKAYGFDIAEEGGDETVGYLYHGGKLTRVHAARGGETPGRDAEDAIKENVQPFQRVAIDANGTGRGVYEGLVKANYDVIAHKGSLKARRPDVYANRKSELFYEMQKAMQKREVGIDPADIILAGQLLSVRWAYGDRLTVETRREREKRSEDSPDRADAATIARYYAVSSDSTPASSVATPVAGPDDGRGVVQEWQADRGSVMQRDF